MPAKNLIISFIQQLIQEPEESELAKVIEIMDIGHTMINIALIYIIDQENWCYI